MPVISLYLNGATGTIEEGELEANCDVSHLQKWLPCVQYAATRSSRNIFSQNCIRLLQCCMGGILSISPLNAKLNPICHLLALLGAHHILHVSMIRVK